ncbi:MAG TPA: PAS domain S-box protein [Armatimonadota bacterium]|jgi:PAS domain S-box-containing protein
MGPGESCPSSTNADSSALLKMLAVTSEAGGLRQILDLLPLGALAITGDTADTARVVCSNAALSRIVGGETRPGAPVTELPFQLFPPTRQAPLPSQQLPFMRSLLLGEAVRKAELHLRRPDGLWRVVLVSSATLSAPGGPAVTLATLQDLTHLQREREELRAAHRALRETGDRYRGLVEMSPDAVFVNTDSRITFVNQAAVDLFGAASPEELLGRSPFDLFPPRYHDTMRERIRELLRGNRAPLIEAPVSRLDGTERVAEVAACSFVDGERPAIQVILRDITDRKQAELERELALDFLHRVNESDSTEQLAQAAVEFVRQHSEADAVALRLQEQGRYPVAAASGFEPPMGDLLCDEVGPEGGVGLPGRCLCRKVIGGSLGLGPPGFSSGGSFWTNSSTSFLLGLPPSERGDWASCRCLSQGAELVAVLPISIGDERLGLLQLFGRDPGHFSPSLLEFWERLTDHLAVALARLRAEEVLRRREADLRLTMDAVPAMIAYIDSECRYRRANSHFLEFVGLGKEAVLGHTIREVGGEEAWRAIEPQVKRALSGESVSYEQQLPVRDRGPSWVQATYTPDLDEAGRVRGFVLHAADVGERKRAEEELRQSYLQHRIALDAADLGTWRHDLQTNRRYMDERARRHFGFDTSEVAFAQLQERIHPDDLPRLQEEMDRALDPVAGSGRWSTEYRMRQPDGSYRRLAVHVRALFEGSGPQRRAVLTVGTSQDISERRLVEEARERLTAILEATPDLVGTMDVEGKLLSLNRAGRRMAGLAEDEAPTGLRLQDLLRPVSPEPEPNTPLLAAVREGAWTGEAVLLSRDGRQTPVSQVLLAHRSSEGDVSFLSMVVRDMTQQKHLEEELRQSQKMEAIGRLAGGVAHDFNNLLMPIMSYSQMLCDQLDPDGRPHRYAVAVAEAAERAAALPRQLLAFSRKQVIQPRVVDLNQIMAGAEKMLRRLIGEDIALAAVPDPNLGRVRADPGQMEQVLFNLVVNARDAMPQGGKLTLETQNLDLDDTFARRLSDLEPGRYVMLAVSDTGHGMDRETLSRAFDPFFTTKGPDQGTGLGLSTVYGIVKQSKGEVRVYSEVDRGSTFRVYLPRVDEPLEASQVQVSAGAAPGGSETILLVEDEEPVREATRTVLESGGYRVLVARSGEEGLSLAHARADNIDLLLTDVVMPGITGRQLADQVSQQRPGLRVLFMSGYTENAILQHGVLGEGVAFLQKPFTPGVLLRKVREVLDLPREGEAPSVREG